MLRRTFFLIAALFLVSACGANCNSSYPYGSAYPSTYAYSQPNCSMYGSQYPYGATGYPYTTGVSGYSVYPSGTVYPAGYCAANPFLCH